MPQGLEIAAALVSIGSALFAVAAWFASRRQALAAEESASRAREEAAAIAREANELAALRWSSQHFDGLRKWAAAATEAMCEAQELLSAPGDPRQEERRQHLRGTLSAALDTGRWYFPNSFETKYGRDNPPAYRGVRAPVLDSLYDAYKALEASSSDREARAAVIAAKRAFVSHVQLELDPRRLNDRLDAVRQRFGEVDRMRDGG